MVNLRALDFNRDSAHLDELLGFQMTGIEEALLKRSLEVAPEGNHHTWGAAIHDGHQSWVGLHPQTLMTPYSELREMCEVIRPGAGSRLVDLGAGYGRMGVVLAALHPEVLYTGYELVPERVKEGNRVLKSLGCLKAALFEQDLTQDSFLLPGAEVYFIYDYGKVEHIRKTLDQLSLLADQYAFKVIGRGKGTRSLIQHEYPWLATVHEAYHSENFSIYSTHG